MGDHVLPKVTDRVLERLKQLATGHILRGIPTGVKFWDDAFGGLVPGQFICLAARPMLFKSALMEQIASHLLMNEEPVCIFAQDMAPDQMLERMACRLAEVPKWNLDHGKADKEELAEVKHFVEALSKSKLRLHSIERMNGEKLITVCKREARKYGVRSFWLDHVQTLDIGKDEPRIAYGKASKLIRNFVTKFDVNFVALAHLNREAAKSRAAVHQIKEFDDILGDVDAMPLIHTDIDPTTLVRGQDWPMEFIVGKNRSGPPMTILIQADRRLMSLTERPQPQLAVLASARRR
jgi:replicative DNA helicase